MGYSFNGWEPISGGQQVMHKNNGISELAHQEASISSIYFYSPEQEVRLLQSIATLMVGSNWSQNFQVGIMMSQPK